MRNRLVALIMTLFAGGFGLHKFYLGENFAGLMYLLFSLTFIPTVLAFFDFLGLAFMSDRAFNRKFNGVTENPRVFEEPRVFIANPHKESARDIAATLRELKTLYEDGVITAEEYEIKRRKLLASI